MIVKLLGPPEIVDSQGEPISVRGKKTWGLIARVPLPDPPVSRRRLAEELFGTADDPMGALRWALAQIRRSLGDPDSFRNDPVEANISTALVGKSQKRSAVYDIVTNPTTVTVTVA